jgi:hypothetical protein
MKHERAVNLGARKWSPAAKSEEIAYGLKISAVQLLIVVRKYLRVRNRVQLEELKSDILLAGYSGRTTLEHV